MISLVARLTEVRPPIAFFARQTCAVRYGHLEPLSDPPVLVGLEPLDAKKRVFALHVPDLRVARQLVADPAFEWIRGEVHAKASAAAGDFTWPTVTPEEGPPYEVGLSRISGGTARQEDP